MDDIEEDDIENEPLSVNERKSRGARKRWGSNEGEEGQILTVDRGSKRFDYKCFEGMGLSKMQKEFVVRFMDSPHLGKRENRYKAYAEVFNASNENSLKANCTALMNKSKIKEAIIAYQAFSLRNHKLEVTTESIESLRRRANYDISTFYNDDGTCKPLNEIDKEWLVCIDNIKIDKKSNAGKGVIETKEYKLCDRDRAMERLQKLLGVYQDMETLNISVPMREERNVTDSVEDTNSNKPRQPRVTFTIGVDQ